MKLSTFRHFTTAVLSLSIVCFSCTKGNDDNDNPDDENTKDVYIAGYEFNSSGKKVARYWKNTVAVTLTDGSTDAIAYSIAAAGNGDVYVVGTENNGPSNGSKYVAKYWKNGRPFSLTNGAYTAEANAIVIAGNDVYIAGYENKGVNNVVPRCWKNGTSIPLSGTESPTYSGWGYAVAIYGNDVYLAGTALPGGGIFKPKYWKNGTPTFLQGDNSAKIFSMTISGGDVYAAGYEDKVINLQTEYAMARYWKNGVAVSLTNGTSNSSIRSLAVSGSDVHAVGYGYSGTTNQIIKYWKNGTEQPLLGIQNGSAESIALSGSDVYIAGFETIGAKSTAKYWKNGGEGMFLQTTGHGGVAYEVFLK